MSFRSGFTTVVFLLLCCTSVWSQPVLDEDSGHYYDLVEVTGGINWTDARDEAEESTYLGVAGHLATVTSDAEIDFLVDNFGEDLRGTYLGGFQPAGSPEPAGGWEWVTGETWDYTNWAAGEPNGSTENALHFMGTGTGAALGEWNDIPDTAMQGGYVIEYPVNDCNGNLVPDSSDIEEGTSSDCNDNTIPDECEDTEILKLTASDGAAGDELGAAVATSGSRIAVGAPGDDDAGEEAGAIYVYRSDDEGWEEEARLVGDDVEEDDGFGSTIALDGDVVAVGTPLDDEAASNAGAIYIFRFDEDRSEWTEEAKLVATSAASSDQLGGALALSGDLVAAGARTDADGANSGSVFLFEWDGVEWSEIANLTASDAAASDRFGFSVSVADGTVLVGAPNDDDDGTNTGAAYFFTYDDVDDDWVESKVTASDAAVADAFGIAVSISGDLALVGAPFDDDEGSTSGSVYIFERIGDDWTETGKLTASDGEEGAEFGSVLSLGGDRALIGAPALEGDRGKAYVITDIGGTPTEVKRLVAASRDDGDEFGIAVSVDQVLAIGMVGDDDLANDAGALFAVEIEDLCGGATEFRRGDADADGTAFALLDALFLLEYAFLEGKEPPCMDAGDADGNGTVFALLDALALLEWTFAGGDDPPDPGPLVCGYPDQALYPSIGCESYDSCP